MNSPTIFNHPQFGDTRIIQEDDNLFFIAKDIVERSGNSWAGIASIRHIPEQWRGVKSVLTPSGTQEMLCLSEQGLYFYLGRCDKPSALQYQMWLAGEVMPSIHRHGAYLTPAKVEEVLLNPDTIIRLATDLKAERQQRVALEAQAVSDRPKVIFADAVDASHTSILVGDLAKLLRQNGIEIGQNRLFDWLRDNGYLIKHGDSRNMPTQRAMEMELFEIKERTINNPDGSIRITKTPKITGKGQIYFVNKFKMKHSA